MLQDTQISGHRLLQNVVDAVRLRVVGQDETVHALLVGLLTGGHLLLEGLPGLAKTLLVRSLADALHTSFGRIQLTPDLLPGDIVGTPVYHHESGEFRVSKGPIFANVILADEINRAPPKVQSALLEAMEEGQVTIDGKSYPLPAPFLVLATQNPIELQGTYPLAEAQLDRFMMKVKIGYPDRAQEREIIRRVALKPDAEHAPIETPTTVEEIFTARAELQEVRVDESIEDYVVDLVFATREPERAGLSDLRELMEFGISPRATIFLTRAARAHAYLLGRDFVLPDDVKAMAPPVLRHRLRTTYEADARGIDADQLVDRLLAAVPAP
ncbi:MAG: AAA family ATPase [Gemmatimonadota bacterium]